MKRRAFLHSAAGFLPAVAFPAFCPPQPASTPVSMEPHVVPSGEDRFGEFHSRGFSRILFKVMPGETGDGLFVVEHTRLVKGGPPFHLHLRQEEWFYVIEGEVLFQIGETRKKLAAGDSLLAPRNIPHAFTLAGGKPGRMLIAFTPAGKMEQFFRDTAVQNPPAQDAAFFRRYEMELIGPSPFAA